MYRVVHVVNVKRKSMALGQLTGGRYSTLTEIVQRVTIPLEKSAAIQAD